MARLDPPTLEELTPEQKAIYNAVGRGRTRVTGPFSVLLHKPVLADAVNRVIRAVREDGKLDKRLYELIVLTVTRHCSAAYAWSVHVAPAKETGISSEIVDAIHAKRKPVFSKPDEKAIYEAVTSLLQDNKLSDAAYQGLLKEFGLDLTIDIVTIAGLYCMISTVINGFEVPTLNGEKPF